MSGMQAGLYYIDMIATHQTSSVLTGHYEVLSEGVIIQTRGRSMDTM